MDNKKPSHLIILKIIGFSALVVAVVGIVLIVNGFGNFENNNFMIGGVMCCLGLFVGISCLMFGFSPEISKLNAKTQKYIQQETKSDLKDISTTNAEIHSEAVTTTVKAVKEGLQDSIYCKHCGERIDSDSKFCKSCGKQQ